MGLPSGREVRGFPRISQRRPDFGSQHLSRGTNRVPADWSSGSVALPMDSLADEPLGRDAGPYSPFAAMLLSPQPFRVEVFGRAVTQPVRRCITHLLPVRPTSVGRTDLTSQGAPRRFSPGNPDDPAANALGTGLSMPGRDPAYSVGENAITTTTVCSQCTFRVRLLDDLHRLIARDCG